MRLRFYFGVLLLALAAGLLAYRGRIVASASQYFSRRDLPRAKSYSSILESMAVSRPQPLPAEFNLAVPFTSQAPLGVWDHAHEEACEEASVMMVDAFYGGRAFTPERAEAEIKKAMEWETRVLGHWEDTTAEETARILREKYNYPNTRVVYDPTLAMIKGEVAHGHPVILPAAGRLLHNRYFSGSGPIYHMLVVRGWTAYGMIITNDPGTKRGEAYLYDPEILMRAMHDWNNGDVLNGRKVMIVVEK